MADKLSKLFGATVIDKDDIKDVIDDAFPDFNTGGISYDAMLKLVERNLKNGLDVICDSPLTFEDLYERAVKMTEAHGHDLHVIRLVCGDDKEWGRRLQTRAGGPAHRMAELTPELKKSGMRYDVQDELVIDTSQDTETNMEKIRSHCRVKEIA